MNTSETENRVLPFGRAQALLDILRVRFEQHPRRHPGISWQDVLSRLQAQPQKLWTLEQMETSGGEPDVVGQDPETGVYVFADCSEETPSGRRNLCYDRAALDARKTAKPQGSAVEMAEAMGAALLNEEEYRGRGRIRPQNVQLDRNPRGCARAWRRAVRGPALRAGLCVSQRRFLLLRGARFPRRGQGLTFLSDASSKAFFAPT